MYRSGGGARFRRIAQAAVAGLTLSASFVAFEAGPAAAAPPVVGGGGQYAYLESDPALAIGTGLTVSNGLAYAGQYLQFGVNSSTAGERLTLSTDAVPSTASGVVSIVGSNVYLGNGTVADPIGIVDGVLDGQSGRALRVNFTNAFENPGFETADLSSWTALNRRIDLGNDTIAGCSVIDTASYPGFAPNADNNVPNTMGSYSTAVDSTQHSAGAYSLRLLSTGITTRAGYDVVHGPAVFSSSFAASAGDKIYFDWQARSGDDAEAVFGYVVNEATCAQTEVLDHTGSSTSGSTSWATVSTTIPATGNYKFVFVSGTYDLSGGQVAGASLYIDNVRVFGTKATDDVAQQIARRLQYQNVALDVPATRTVTVTARNATAETGTTSIRVDVTPLDEAPVYLDDTLASFRRNVTYSDAVTTRAWPFATYAVTGTVPTGVVFDAATASFSGTPTTGEQAYDFTITASNRAGDTTRRYTGRVHAAPTAFSDADTGQFLLGVTHTDAVVANGFPAPTYSIAAGSLPAGISLNPATGALTGTPTAFGPYSFTVRATNAEGFTSAPFSGNVYRAPTFTDGSLGTFVTDVAYTDGVAATAIPAATYSVTSGQLPAGVSLDPTTGAVTGTPTEIEAPYSFQITASNVAGTAVATFSGFVETEPTVYLDGDIGQLRLGVAHSDGVQANGMQHPTYAVTSGLLPAGLTLNSVTGAITGTPTRLGPYSFWITAGNAHGSISHRLTGVVSSVPVFTDDTLVALTTGVTVTDGVAASGSPLATYSVTAGVLPAGLTLDPATGAITGTPTGVELPYSFEITATNVGGSVSVTFSGTIRTEPRSFLDDEIGLLVIGAPFIDGVDASGFPAPTYAVTDGELPDGLTLDPSTGAIVGTPTAVGDYSFEITATNGEGSIARTFSGAVTAPPVFTDADLAGPVLGVAFTDGVLASGYPSPVYAVSVGSLPSGLSLDAATGAITGTPSETGPYSFTISATTPAGVATSEHSGTVTSVPSPSPVAQLGALTVNTSFALSVASSSALPAPTYAVTAGSLPAGLILDPISGRITGTPSASGAYSFTITATNSAGSTATIFSGVIAAEDRGYLGLNPVRLFDSRTDGTAVAAGSVTRIQVVGRGGVPEDSTAAVFNVTVVDPAGAGYATVYPCDSERPFASNVNFDAGETVSNAVTAALGVAGDVCIYTTTAMHLVVDAGGAFSPSSGAGHLVPMAPVRAFDSRDAGVAVLGGSTTEIDVAGAFGIDATAEAVVLNVTVTEPVANGFVTVYPCGSERPWASNVNFETGETVPNAVTATVGVDGTVCIFSTATTHLVVDVNGSFVADGVGRLRAVMPTRLHDSRESGVAPTAGSTLELQVAGRGPVPADAIAAVFNVTVAAPQGSGFVTVYPCADGRPWASNANVVIGQTVSNMVTSAIDADGKVCFYSMSPVHLVIDVDAVYTPMVNA